LTANPIVIVKFKAVILALLILNLVSMILALSLGSSGIGLGDFFNIFEDDRAMQIIFNYRMPRLLLTMVVGASLSSAGCAMQAFFRNPLADPYVLGVSSGASVGAAIAVLIGVGTIYNTIALAFFLSLISAFVVYRIGTSASLREQTYAILLAGIAMASFLSGLTSILIYLAGEGMHKVIFWIMGSFSNPLWSEVYFAVPIALFGMIYLLFQSWNLNAVLLGDEHAMAVGIDVEKFRKYLIAIVSLLTSAAVAVSGVIGFVGIIIPHTMRLLVGEAHQRLLPAAILFGSAFMPMVDLIARTATSGELPVGAITAMLGAPFFIYLLRRGA
jgi:iron complex transport system permease protein